MGLTTLDILVLLLVGGGALLGVLRGFVTETLSLFAWIAAILAVKMAHGPATILLAGRLGTPTAASVAAFVLIFGVVFVGGKLVAGAIGRRTRQSVLGPLDRLLGFGFGALKGLIGATLLFLLANLATDTFYGGKSARPDWMIESRTFPLLNASSRAIVDFVAMRRAAGRAAAGERPASR
ncbi:CvpA family protein [Sphingomonas solaris]|uniref:CvpA family protein n=1 Tax=Alterirhizorhabdus solaris TaxID=2529389 RepID=A0A558QXF3_9SPHN|nr:CvpA family protein [Sphingomonas solaris]TVV71843.1 CvpA family protein [Sphingomonas solaris]